jgi:hypothetical protein
MGETPLERIKYCLYKYSSDFSFIGEVPEEVVIKRANALLIAFEKRNAHGGPFYEELKQHMIDYFLLEKSV